MKETEIRKYLAELGRRGGKKRAEQLSAKERSEIARKGAVARWAKRREAKKEA